MKAHHKLFWFFITGMLITSGCKKDWLDAKPNKNLVVPTSLSDMQGMLDNTTFVFNNGQPALGEIGCDDYYVLYNDWQGLYTNTERNAYIWAKEIYNGESVTDWMLPYQRIFYENYILENIDNVPVDSTNKSEWNNVKGSALFCRSFDFYSLADIFAKPYDAATAAQDLGIPLRLHSDINEPSVRSTIAQTFQQIIADIKASADLLPVTPLFKTRPSKAAAYSILARTYLCMNNYDSALYYANASLKLDNTLMDYNSLDATASFPFSIFNDEVIYHTVFNYPEIISNYISIVDSTLYLSYADNDLRRYLFFDTTDGYPRFKGGYDGYTVFAGLATDEMYLTRAECYARTGNTAAAMNDLNKLLQTRFRTGTFIPLTVSNVHDALKIVLAERRKELLYRGLRWTDLRRLNKESDFAITLTRDLNGQQYTLPANDERYVYPIPEQEINISGIQQNPR